MHCVTAEISDTSMKSVQVSFLTENHYFGCDGAIEICNELTFGFYTRPSQFPVSRVHNSKSVHYIV